jgi:hypothetical protein
MATPSPHTPSRKFPVGSIVIGLHASLNETVVFGTMVSTPVVLSRSKVTRPDVVPLFVLANSYGCVVGEKLSGAAPGNVRKNKDEKRNVKRYKSNLIKFQYPPIWNEAPQEASNGVY